ncbi:MAG: site-specific integrase [Patescibacteria group bacterium]|nr:site-specific integrase [Patescibacteria group bacterium]
MPRPKNAEINVFVVIASRRKFLQLRYRDPTTGEPVSKSSRTTDYDQALKAAGEWQAELRKNPPKPKSKTSWDQCRDLYETEHLSSLDPDTFSKVDGVLNSVEERLNPARVEDLDAVALSKLQSLLREDGRAETTIAGHMAHLKAFFNWLKTNHRIAAVPDFPKIQRAKKGKRARVMKGRPITDVEFQQMIEAVPTVVSADDAPAWRRLIEGLYLGGLRLSEALDFWWDRTDRMHVDFTGDYPTLRVYAEDEKGNTDRILPIVPEFGEFLLRTPKRERKGLVFPLPKEKEKSKYAGQPLQMRSVSRTISDVGEAAGIMVNSRTEKYASAHDLRRSFGERWALKVMPQVLQQLMRHDSIETTNRFYAIRDAQAVSEIVWGTNRVSVSGVTKRKKKRTSTEIPDK